MSTMRTPSPSSSVSSSSKITRSVIRQLEVIQQHDSSSELDDDTDDDAEAISVEPSKSGSEDEEEFDSHDESEHTVVTAPVPAAVLRRKIDWEIPRKTLHSSIGFFTLYLFVTRSSPRPVILVLWTALAVIVPADVLRLRYPAFERVYEKYLGAFMRESEKSSPNGVIWYILGVNFALTAYPLDVATVAILILSWADTAASTLGRMYGMYTPPLPTHISLPVPKWLPLPGLTTPVKDNSSKRAIRIPLFAHRKSTAGFIAATLSGTLIAIGFWIYVVPYSNRPLSDVSWNFKNGVTLASGKDIIPSTVWNGGGILGTVLIAIVAGVVSGVAEALDIPLDDNLTLPIISGGCILGFLKLLHTAVGW